LTIIALVRVRDDSYPDPTVRQKASLAPGHARIDDRTEHDQVRRPTCRWSPNEEAAIYIPEGSHTVTPRIVVHDARGLIEFLKRVFAATGDYRQALPSEVRMGDSVVMVSDAGIRSSMTAFLYVYVRDTDATYQRALDAGARSLEEPSDMPYGDRRCMVEDKWGNTWQIATHMGDGDAT
jgi:PhnB protein